MRKTKQLFILMGTAILLGIGLCHFGSLNEVRAAEKITLIDLNTSWHYYDQETDPVESGDRTAWTRASFDISNWKTSPPEAEAKFGAKKGKLAEVDSHMPAILLNQYKSSSAESIEAYFFRTTVNIDNISEYEDLYLFGEVLYDDAALIYINGELIAEFANQQRDDSSKKFDQNMQYGGQSGVEKGLFSVPATCLTEGDNIIAVEIHQIRASSSDIYFQMSSLTLEEKITTQKAVALSVGADETSRNITWYCNEATAGTVQYGEAINGNFPKEYREIPASAEITGDGYYYSNKAVISNLKEDTQYVYRLVNGECVSKIYHFQTTGKKEFSFLAVGDPQIGASSTESDKEKWGKTLTKAKQAFPDAAFLLSAGDQVNTNDNETQYDAFLAKMLDSEFPLAASIGNHDSGSGIYSQHYNHPNVTSYGKSNAGTNYWFVYNDVLFMNLNSNSESIAEHKAFIKEAIQENPNVNWKIVTFHHSIYSAANHASSSNILKRRENYVPIFEEFDIDLVLMGHDHVYVRSYIMDGFTPMVTEEVEHSATDPEGILYMTLNSSSGSKYYSISGQYEYAAIQSQEKIPTISNVTVTDTSLKITTHRVDQAMSVLDEFTIYHTKPASKKEVYRISGPTRYETSFKAADALKAKLGIEKFDTILVSSGTNFADALAGSYLASIKNAPILIVNESAPDILADYIKNNLNANGKIYILGGTAAVSEKIENAIKVYGEVKRLGGKTRYDTNLAILDEAGVTNEDILVCTGTGFADSLSASALRRPILLVNNKLTEGQADFLSHLNNNKIYILGGTAAVSETVENTIRNYGEVKRISGETRYDTSVEVAKQFFEDPSAVILAYGENFPDGLSGGPLAISMNAPLILSSTKAEITTAEYTTENEIRSGIVLGGNGLISDDAARRIFNADDILY